MTRCSNSMESKEQKEYWARKDAKRAEIKDWIIEELKAKGVKIYLGGCGCCGSPWVAVEIDGVMLTADSPDKNGILKLGGENIDMLNVE